MREHLDKQICTLVLGLLLASPAVAQQAPESPGSSQDRRLLAVLTPLGEEKDVEVKKSRAKVFPRSSASGRLPGPRLLALGSEAGDGAPEHRNLFGFGFSLSQDYDDNIFGNSGRIADAFWRFSPSFTLDRLGRRTSTNIRYRGDGRAYARHSDLNAFGHNLTFHQAFQGTRWSAAFYHDFNYTPDPFSALRLGAVGEDVNNLVGPEVSLVTPRTDRLFNSTTVELGYRKSVRTSFALAAGYLDARGRGDQFIDYNEGTLRATYNYRYSPRGTLSVFPNVRLVRSERALGDSQSYGLLLGHSYQVRDRVWISFHGGPEYTRLEQSPTFGLAPEVAALISLLGPTRPEARTVTSWSGGANVVYNRKRSALGLSYSRAVTGSGGVAGPVRNETVSISVSGGLVGHWSSRLHLSYSENRGFDSLASSHESVNAGLRLERRLGESASFFVGYSFLHQSSDFAGLSFTRNYVTAGFAWGSRPVLLGR